MMALICVSDKAKYFSSECLTGIRKTHLSGKSVELRRGDLRAFVASGVLRSQQLGARTHKSGSLGLEHLDVRYTRDSGARAGIAGGLSRANKRQCIQLGGLPK